MKKLLKMLWNRAPHDVPATIDNDEDLWLHLDGAEFMVFPPLTYLSQAYEQTDAAITQSKIG